MSNYKKERFNIKAYSRLSRQPRSTIYSLLDSLLKKGLIYKEHIGSYKITSKGITTADLLRGETRSVEIAPHGVSRNLSTHFLKYKIPIEDKSFFSEERLKELNPIRTKALEIPNQRIIYAYFQDATIIIHPKQMIIRVHDIIGQETEETHLEAFNKACDYLNKLNEIGLKGSKIELETTHWARVKSILSDVLKKIDEHYFVELGKGRKFWIDYSPGKEAEDETNDKEARDKIDSLMKDVVNSEHSFSDIDKIIKALGIVAKIESTRLVASSQNLNTPKQKEEITKRRSDYIG